MSERLEENEVTMSAPRAIVVRTSAVVYDLLLLIAVWFVVTAVLLTLNDGQGDRESALRARDARTRLAVLRCVVATHRADARHARVAPETRR